MFLVLVLFYFIEREIEYEIICVEKGYLEGIGREERIW